MITMFIEHVDTQGHANNLTPAHTHTAAQVLSTEHHERDAARIHQDAAPLNSYLLSTVMPVITSALADIVIHRPNDPIQVCM